jgi:hypothetical protein
MTESIQPPKRNIAQFRPKGDPSAPMYAPQRDLAYIYAPAVREAFFGLQPEHIGPYAKDLMQQQGLDFETLGLAVERFVAAHESFVHDPEISSPEDALRRSGFLDMPQLAQLLIYSRIGATMTGGFFVALRDVTPFFAGVPPEVELAQMLGSGRALAAWCQGCNEDDPVIADGLKAELETTKAELAQCKHAISRKSAEFVEFRHAVITRQQAAMEDFKRAWRKRPWWKRLLNRDP